jgi:hydrogenase maturation factor
MAVAAGQEDVLLHHFNEQSIPATVVGELTEKSEGTILIEDGMETSFEYDGNDPYWNAFFEAMEKGWK